MSAVCRLLGGQCTPKQPLRLVDLALAREQLRQLIGARCIDFKEDFVLLLLLLLLES